MSSMVDNSGVKGNILMLATLVVTLVVPLALILLSYIGIISGIAEILTALAVILSIIYIIGGIVWMAVQDKKDAYQLTDG